MPLRNEKPSSRGNVYFYEQNSDHPLTTDTRAIRWDVENTLDITHEFGLQKDLIVLHSSISSCLVVLCRQSTP